MKTDPSHKPEDADFQPLGTYSTGSSGVLPKFQLKQILVPVDFSKCSAKALQYAIPFARQFGAELVLLHVIPPSVVLPSAELLPEGLPESPLDVLHSLDEMRNSIGADIPSRSLVRNGSPPIEIIDAARELDIDLIIVSTHGRTGLSQILMGNTVEKVVRRAGCPVLVVREHEHEFIRVD